MIRTAGPAMPATTTGRTAMPATTTGRNAGHHHRRPARWRRPPDTRRPIRQAATRLRAAGATGTIPSALPLGEML
jgi:hypothetical protein